MHTIELNEIRKALAIIKEANYFPFSSVEFTLDGEKVILDDHLVKGCDGYVNKLGWSNSEVANLLFHVLNKRKKPTVGYWYKFMAGEQERIMLKTYYWSEPDNAFMYTEDKHDFATIEETEAFCKARNIELRDAAEEE